MNHDPAALIRAIEAAGRRRKLRPEDLCKMADISRSQWQRLKAGKGGTRLDTWDKLQGLADSLAKSATKTKRGGS